MSSRNDDSRQSLVSDYRGSPPDALVISGSPDQEEGLDGQQKQMVAASSREGQLAYINQIDRRIVELAVKWFEPAARFSIFVIYFWFGLLKALNLSPATPLAQALTARTIGMQYFNTSFKTLAVFECIIGILFLVPALTRLSIALIVVHLGVVSSPLVIVPSVAFTHPLVPTLEGQYIIKDLALLALAIGIMAQRQLPSRQ
jgi:uncharacterized membrane protein YkgB